MGPTKTRLAGCLLVALMAGVDPHALVSQLGSPRYSEREAATVALEKLGEAALPVLREARLDRDPEVKSRAEFLLDAIERGMLTRSAMIRLSKERLSYTDVVEEVGKAEGVAIQFNERGPLASRTLQNPPGESVTFWPLVDRMGLAPHWEAEAGFGGRGFGGPGFGGPGFGGQGMRPPQVFSLIAKTGGGGQSHDTGPFRLTARPPSLSFEPQPFDAGFRAPGTGRAPRPERELDFVVPIELMAEPRLTLRALGVIQVLEAVDDLGQSLTSSARGIADPNAAMLRGEQSSPVLPFQVRLKPLTQRGKVLRRLRGIIPVEVEARKIEPSVIPFSPNPQGEHNPVSCGGTTVLVHSLAPAADGSGSYQLEVSFRQDSSRVMGLNGRNANRRMQELLGDSDPLWRNLEIVDASGQPMIMSEQRTLSVTIDGGIRKALTIAPREAGSSPPSEMRYHGEIRATVDVPFEFRDLRLP